jgi:IS30 family transposase
MTGYKQLSYHDRLNIENMYNRGNKVHAIAAYLDRPRQTVYNEIKRGLYEHRDTHLRTTMKYAADKAQAFHDRNAAAKGTQLKIGNNHELAAKIEYYIIEEDCSPYVAIQRTGKPFCVSTLYSYIDKGIFSRLTNACLPEKSRRKKRSYHEVKQAKRPPAGTSIEKRPVHIKERKTAGHWEMDCVIGKAKGKGQALLVLTERKTAAELIFHLKEKTASNVVRVLDRLSKNEHFNSIFKSITVDNGSEFAAAYDMEFDRYGNRRTHVYYCHPYTSCERPQNECYNKMVRRKFPKGVSLEKCTSKETRKAMHWQNNYERKCLGGETPAQRFLKEFDIPIEIFY